MTLKNVKKLYFSFPALYDEINERSLLAIILHLVYIIIWTDKIYRKNFFIILHIQLNV